MKDQPVNSKIVCYQDWVLLWHTGFYPLTFCHNLITVAVLICSVSLISLSCIFMGCLNNNYCWFIHLYPMNQKCYCYFWYFLSLYPHFMFIFSTLKVISLNLLFCCVLNSIFLVPHSHTPSFQYLPHPLIFIGNWLFQCIF